jgi:hypothetical protein
VAAGIYSTRFLKLNVNGVAATYVVPAGKVAVIQSVIAVAASTAAGGLEVQAGFVYLVVASVPAKETRTWTDLRFVVYEGETIVAFLPLANTYCSVHGYLFDNVSGTKAPALDYELVERLAPLPIEEGLPAA